MLNARLLSTTFTGQPGSKDVVQFAEGKICSKWPVNPLKKLPTMKNETARKRLARIRCLLDTIKRMEQGKPLPLALCYVRGEIIYGASSETSSETIPIPVLRKPSKDAEKLGEIYITSGIEVSASGDEYNNKYGRWIKLNQKSLQKFCTASSKTIKEGWVLHIPCDPKQGPGKECLTQLPNKSQSSHKKASGSKGRNFLSWTEAVEVSYTLQLTEPPVIDKYGDKEAMKELSTPPPKWNLDADEELAKFLTDHVNKHETSLGNISRFVEDIDVSSESETKNNLTDGDPDSFWESDGSQGRHWIKLTLKPGTVIRRLYLGVDSRDDNYMPYKVFVYGGETGSMKLLNEVYIDLNFTGDALVLESMTQYFHIIDIRIKECKDDGIDTRIHGIKIVSASEKEPGLSIDILSTAQLVRFPKLDAVDIPLLYRRAQVLQRFIDLLDSVIHYLLPSWNYTVGSFNDLEAIRQLLPLSRYRNNLLEKFLKESQTGPPPRMPKLFINRRLAAEHRADPSQDPEGKNTIFHQLYESLQQERCGVKLDYRWPGRYDQWWECKFLSEGIIDQGGGFRDSLADMAEELCPSAMDDPMPLHYFVRTPNQLQDSSSVNRDSYIPSPSCKEFSKLEWLGMIMGACLRSGREHLVVSLPSFVWKPLVGERVTWSRDFNTVDLAQVKLLERLQTVDKETFDIKFGGVLTFTTVLSDNTLVNLVPGGSERFVEYDEKELYSKLVQKHRMNESKQQIDAIRRGLLKVVPQAVLDLLTWQELERRVCGDPEITVEALKKCSHYEDMSADNDQRVKDLWQALENFTNEDRSRFLRFVTGRRRLPAPLFICPGRSNAEVDSLPEAATCSSTLFLPKYSSPKVAEEKIRYAAYNCVAIDTDVSPWEE